MNTSVVGPQTSLTEIQLLYTRFQTMLNKAYISLHCCYSESLMVKAAPYMQEFALCKGL